MRKRRGVREGLRKLRKKIRDDFLYLLALTGTRLFRRLPLSLGIRIGGVLGIAAYFLLPKERARAREHLDIAFSSELSLRQRKSIALRCFGNLGRSAVELLNFSRLKDELDRWVTLEGREFLDQALEKGRGVIWITGHVGNWELMACYMAAQGYAFRVVAREIYEERLNRLLMGFRREASVKVILRDSPAAGRQMLKALKAGEVIGMLIDQDTRVRGVMADFFGRKANTPAGAAILARRRDIPVLAGFIHRVADRHHRIVIHPPIETRKTDDEAGDIVANTERFNSVLEQAIREDPAGWVWMHRRWMRNAAYEPAGRRGSVQV
jgi:KDO2-lipid IV(A) lauroyltransferase